MKLTEDQRCEVCHGESTDSRYVGVAAVPGAPLSVACCTNCLRMNAVPRIVAETWLFSEFYYDGAPKMKKRPPRKFPLADWAGEFTVWMGPGSGYVLLRQCYKDLWKHEYENSKHKRSK